MILGVMGQAQAGKDSFVQALVAHGGFTRVAFADPLKALALACDPWIQYIEYPDGPDEAFAYVRLSILVGEIGWERAKSEYPEVRKFLQDLGVGARDHIDNDVWVNTAMRNRSVKLAISDVRFPNEWETVRASGGKLVRIERPGLEPIAHSNHISETGWRDFEPDYIVVNDGTLDQLYAGACHILELLWGARQ